MNTSNRVKDIKSQQSEKFSLKKSLKSVRNFITPLSKKEKEKRHKQFRDVFFFVGSIFLVSKFSKEIEQFLSVDTKEIQKMATGQM